MTVFMYDTTLRDGSQMEGVSFSVEDKLRIARRLDAFGMDYIEGGWPGAVPKDTEFFARLAAEPLQHSRLAAFGMTRKAGETVEESQLLRFLLEAQTPVVTIVGKSHARHVTETLRIPLDENLAMIQESVAYLKQHGKEVIFDAEHFFDGFKDEREYVLKCMAAAVAGGADWLCPCDTNGGALPHNVAEAISTLVAMFPSTPIAMHPHNDGDCGTANALAAVRAGAIQVQGTINGYGERTGNANLVPIIANLKLKLGYDCLGKAPLTELTALSHFVDEVANFIPSPKAAFVGRNAFTHKAGLHADAISKWPRAYDHIEPSDVGNKRRILISEQAGSASIAQKAAELGYELDKKSPVAKELLNTVTSLEKVGYAFEGAEGSFELLLKKATGDYRTFFELVTYRVFIGKRATDEIPVTEATIKLKVNDEEINAVAEGDGPVNALDLALRKALEPLYPQLKNIELTDYKVRVVTMGEGTAAKVRTIVESTDHHGRRWATVGVSTNLIEASWLAVVDSIEYGLLR
ncbi:MAG: citramalate synthase [Armatimonas sp.]